MALQNPPGNSKPFCGGSMDTFWNCKVSHSRTLSNVQTASKSDFLPQNPSKQLSTITLHLLPRKTLYSLNHSLQLLYPSVITPVQDVPASLETLHILEIITICQIIHHCIPMLFENTLILPIFTFKIS